MTRGPENRSAYSFKPGPYSSHTALLAEMPAPGNGRRVLDLGCADGYLGAQLASRGYSVVGVERPGGVTSAFPQSVRLIEADLDQDLPPLEDRFDFVLCADLLEHLRDPLRLLRRLPALLTPSGVLLASLPNSGNLYFRFVVLLGEFPQEDKGLFDRTHLRFYNWKGWLHLFQRGGFEISRVRPTGIPVGLAFPRWENAAPVRFAEWLSYRLGLIWRSMFAYQFVVAGRPLPAGGNS